VYCRPRRAAVFSTQRSSPNGRPRAKHSFNCLNRKTGRVQLSRSDNVWLRFVFASKKQRSTDPESCHQRLDVDLGELPFAFEEHRYGRFAADDFADVGPREGK
jgi:hypothetical protein